MRENPFLCRVYICNKRVEVESVLHLLFYILKKETAKEEVLDGYGRTFLFMMVSILLVSLFRRNYQGVI